ncbi:hypothetical protein TNCV_4617061 [Trichonephila clavipes]|nr:hypothetical protein TNCV_4617061 [Trichonephila clavipes]
MGQTSPQTHLKGHYAYEHYVIIRPLMSDRYTSTVLFCSLCVCVLVFSLRSIRAGDFELLKFVLPKITNLFFICNQPNYAWWASKYYDNLIKVAETLPDLFEEFQKGFFGIQRTCKTFSRQPIDLVLEKTINADAARRLTGIIQFTNSISTRQRWALSHDIRSTIISYVYKDLDLQIEQDVAA